MRASFIQAFVAAAALTLTGCSVSPSALLSATSSRGATPPPAAAATAAPKSAAPSGQVSSSVDPATAAIQAVIQKANAEQQTAFAKGDPSVMKDTATTAYYEQLVQINGDMASGGVSTIKLAKIEWGPITLTGATSAQATTYETWQTSYADGSTDQSRDQNVYTLVLDQGNWKIQTDDHPAAVQSPSVGTTLPAPSGRGAPGRSTAPASPAPRAPAGQTDVSGNWSGYAATGGTFTGVTGTWTVPESQASGSLGTSATWVGIGGVNSRDLIQAGTQEMSNAAGASHYEAWIETLPQPSQPVSFAVSPGDSVTVAITEQGQDQWLIAFKNDTTGQTYQTTVQYASSLSSAEWVQEAPSARRGILPLDDFGSVQFTGGSAIEDGKSVTIAQAGAKPITMIDRSGSAVATPSELTADGQGFAVSRANGAPATQPVSVRGGF